MKTDSPFFLVSGPCVIEDEAVTLRIATRLKALTDNLGIPFTFKASYDKANRTAITSFRGPGIQDGLRVLAKIKQTLDVPILSDVHRISEVAAAAQVLDVIQIPAFLCRQTDLLLAVAKTGKPVNVKKGQFLAPWDMIHVVNKARETGNQQIMVCERGVSFGYNNLVADMRSLQVMKTTGCPVVFDATHSVQLPGGQGSTSGGQRDMVPVLARAAMAVGIDGIFMETHPDPDRALSDGPNSWPLAKMAELLEVLVNIDGVVKQDRL